MNKIKKISLILTIVMGATLLQTGCQKNTSVGGTSNADKKVELTFTYWGSPVEKKSIEASIKTFEEANQNIKVNGVYIPSSDFLTKLNAMIAAGNTPDISYSNAWKNQMGKDGLIYNFFDLMKKDPSMKKEDYIDTCWWNWSPTESAGPIMANVTPSLMYNKDMFEAAGVELPPVKVEDAWTWDEFLDVAKTLTIDTKGRNAKDPKFDSNNISQFGFQASNDWISYMPFVYSNGGHYLSKDMKSFGLSEPAATEAIQKLADLINVYHVSPSPVQKNSMPAPATALKSKKIAMYLDGSWNHLDLQESNMNWGVGVLPISKNYTTFLLGGSLIIFKATKHPDEAFKLYKWITDPESSKEITKMFQSIWMPVQTKYYTDPNKIELWASEKLPARPKGFQDAVMKSAYEHRVRNPEVNVVNFLEIDALVSSALDEVWSGKKTAEQAMKEVSEKVNLLVKGTYFGNLS